MLSRRLLEVVAPDLADAYEAKRLEAEEARAAESTRLTMSDDGHGSVFVKAKLPSLHGAMLKKILLAYAVPKHQAAQAAAESQPTPERQPSPERMGQAFCSLLESLTSDDLPEAGGTGATVVVTMAFDTLMGGLTAAKLDTGERITAGTARRLACQAGIIPAVLGSASVPLDLGRQTRFHTKTQRIAIALRDGGCTAGRLRLATRHVPHPPRPLLGVWRRDRRRARPDALPPPPRQSPRPPLRHHQAHRRQDHLPQAHVSSLRSHTAAHVVRTATGPTDQEPTETPSATRRSRGFASTEADSGRASAAT